MGFKESGDVTSVSRIRNKKKHIDDAQPATVDKHFELLMKDDISAIDSEHSNIELNDLPDWYDEELFRAGQDYYWKNLLSMGLVSLIGLLAVIIIPGILNILVFTKQSGTVCAAFRRYLGTVLHVHTLYTADIKDKKSDWWKSLNTIRWKHSTNSRRSSKSENGPITHQSMALTQFGFIGYALLCPTKLSLTNEPEGVEGLTHFWRVLGHVLGISDSMNICRKNSEETKQLCKRLLNEVYAKHMKNQPPNFNHMAYTLVDGMWSIDMTLDADAFIHLWYELSGVEYTKPISTYSWLNAQYRSSVLYLMGIPIIGYFVRNGFNMYVRFNYWIARNCPVIAWLRHGKSETKIHLYPKLTKS